MRFLGNDGDVGEVFGRVNWSSRCQKRDLMSWDWRVGEDGKGCILDEWEGWEDGGGIQVRTVSF